MEPVGLHADQYICIYGCVCGGGGGGVSVCVSISE